jgi:tetratricopeptide (TPR) repeat protein
MPRDPRRELDLLRDQTGPLGFLLWRIISDLLLWTACPADERGRLFRSSPDRPGEALAYAALAAPEIKEPLGVLLTVSATPELADPAAVAEAGYAVAMWAEEQGMKETAVQFTEAVARIQPDSSPYAFVSARLCRRLGDHLRSAMWYRRAMRLARRTQADGIRFSEVDFANAHLGYGNLLADLGRFQEAEPHFWKALKAALRAGRKSLAGSAYHNLLLVTVHREQWPEAIEHAREAVAHYKDGHPRFPLLAFDVAYMWCRQGYFSSALPVFEKILPWVENQRERILVLASLAQSAAAVRDHIRYVRAAKEVLALAAVDTEMTASALYHIAEGARSFHEWDKAEQLAQRSIELAQHRNNATVIGLAERLLEALTVREPGDVDLVPEEGDSVDAAREMILRKLQKQPAPELSSGAVPPERYPTN